MNFDKKILDYLKIENYEDLFLDVPQDIRSSIQGIGRGSSEMDVILESERIGSLNRTDTKIFLGLGSYERYIPASIHDIIMRNEFITSYTPYQSEISQGMLHALFEYQSIISELTKMDVTNSSMYDGPTALGEAVRMAHRVNGLEEILIPENIHINHKQVVETYITGLKLRIVNYPVMEDGTIDLEKLNTLVNEKTSCIITYNPSNYGTIDPKVTKIKEIKRNALHIVYYDPISISILKSPGSYDADIAVGEGQPLGIPLNFGGPYLGLFSFKFKYVRKSPGRLIGQTEDNNKKRAFVMTLQTREQHIRRDKAMSNICTNQALLAIASTAYLSILGTKGLRWVALKSMENTEKTIRAMERLNYIETYKWKNRFFTDFLVDGGKNSAKIFQSLQKVGILGGLEAKKVLYSVPKNIERGIFFAATEMRKQFEIDDLVSKMEMIQ
jgi:glycine dehydrogenase subunit 1